MRLVEIASYAVDILKEVGDKGILNVHLAETLNTPMRRVYDIIAILSASGLVKKKRESKGTRLLWMGETALAEKKIEILSEEAISLRKQNKDLQNQVNEMTTLLNNLQEDIEASPIQTTLKRTQFRTSTVRVRAEESGQILRSTVKGVVAIIETSAPTVSVEPVIKKPTLPVENRPIAK
ncbi:MAG: hypothetical protein ACW976_00195 [Candidatus Ranarchaeia archaeon]|jgi:predicted transcriptional regulator